MIVLAILFVGAALFWSGFEQAGSSLNIFASDLTQRQLGSFTVPASWFQNLNSLFIILLTPAFAAFWLYAEKRWEIPVFVKFGLALIVLGLGFLLLVPGGPHRRRPASRSRSCSSSAPTCCTPSPSCC